MAQQAQTSNATHARLSPSSASRWTACTPSVGFSEYLIARGTIQGSKSTPETIEGSRAHAVAEEVLHAKILALRGEALDLDAPLGGNGANAEMLECAEAYADWVIERATDIAPIDEVSIAIETRVDLTGYIPEGFGTADCYILGGDTLHVIDYKYGRGVAVSATGNAQMRTYALGVLDLVELTTTQEVRTIKTSIYQPRLNRFSTEVLTPEELRQWGEQVLKPRAEEAMRGGGAYVTGGHCKFCPALAHCKAFASQALTVDQLVALDGNELKSPELAVMLRHAEELTGYFTKLRDRATAELLAGGEVPGLKLVAGRSTRYISDEVEAVKLLAEAGVPAEMYQTTKLAGITELGRNLGKKRFEELLGDLIERKEGKPTLAMSDDPRPNIKPTDYFEGIL